MREISIICLLLVIFGTTEISTRNIEDELKDFCEVMPTEQMKRIAEEHLKNDKEFNEAIVFLQSNTWTTLVREVQQNTEWQKLKKRLNDTGLNIDGMLKTFFYSITNLKPIPNVEKTPRSLRAFFDDIELILPIGKLLAMLHEKKQNNTIFQEFYKKISSEEVHKMFENVRKQPEVRRVIMELKSMGARVDDMLELFYGFMNWDSPARMRRRDLKKNSLKEDFEDFKELIPWEKLKNISHEHSVNDKEYGEVVEYLQGPEFARIVNEIKSKKEYIELKNYLEEAGINVEEITELVSELLMNPEPERMTSKKIRTVRSFRTYLDEIEAELPIGKLLALLNDKMEHSEAFKEFITKLSDPKVKKMVEDIRALKEFQEFFEKLQTLGVRIRETFIIVYAFLGWGSPFERI